MMIGPQLRIALGLVTLLLSTVLVADFIGLMPRPEDQLRESRKLLGESLAVQLSSSVAQGREDILASTVKEIVRRNAELNYAALLRENGELLASFGVEMSGASSLFDFSSMDNLVIPIYEEHNRWGEVRVQFAPSADWGMRYLGFPAATLQFILFLGAATLLTFFLFMKKALAELNPTKVVPQRVNAAFDVLAEGVVIIDENERIVLANRSFADRLDADPEQLVGKPVGDYQWDLKGDELEILPWQASLQRGEHIKGMPLKLVTDAKPIAFTVNAAPIEDGQGQTKGVLITFDDVTPLEAKNTELAEMLAKLSKTQAVIQKKNAELEVLATRDPLTGSLNRRAFMDIYQNQFSQAAIKKTDLTVLMVDIDHFKLVNDEHGHGVGDQAIKLIADILSRLFRGKGAVARYGGEEFVISLPGITLAQGLKIACQVCEKIPSIVEHHAIKIDQLTVSIGVASYESDINDLAQLIDRADVGLYQAKNNGRNQACMFDQAFTQGQGTTGSTSPIPHDEKKDLASVAGDEVLSQLKVQLEEMQHIVQNQAEEITHQSMHDDLTGLPNRFLLLDRLTQAMKLSARNNNLAAVVSVSLSAYQTVYYAAGSEAAESMLKQAAQRLENVVRGVDTIGVALNEEALTLSRIAHNELAMLVVDIDSVESIPKIISRVTAALESPFTCFGNDYLNKVHCGIAVFPNDGNEADGLIRNATLARIYAERRSTAISGNAYFCKTIDELSIKNAKIATELRRAIDQDGLQVVYQPKVHAGTQKVTGVEALARWHHPELGHIGPMEFIMVAENIGVIDKLTDWVVRRVCRDIQSGGLGGLRVSVNVSPIELGDPATGDRLLNIVRDCGVSPTQIEVEITESSVLSNFELTRRILSQLQGEGMLVALDDFGTAYSSLNLLLEIPVDVIKIDRSFVTDIQDAPGNQAVVQAIVQMAAAMGKRVVAEGVEHSMERDCLIQLGCQEIQGYFYSKPIPYADLTAFVQKMGATTQPEAAQALAATG